MADAQLEGLSAMQCNAGQWCRGLVADDRTSCEVARPRVGVRVR